MIMHHRWGVMLAVLLAGVGTVMAADSTVAIQRRIGPLLLRIDTYTPSIVRVRVAVNAVSETHPSLSVIASPARVRLDTVETAEEFIVRTDSMVLAIRKRDGSIEFRDRHENALVRASGLGEGSLEEAVVDSERCFHVRQAFQFSPQEGLYGLGQFEDPVMNYHGQDLLLVQANRTAINPFLVSSRGYGILWDNPSRSRFNDRGEESVFWSEVGDQVDYYFCFGPTMDDAVARYRQLTGRAPMFPKSAYGYWQSKERYKSGAELVDVVREYRRRRLPLDNVIQDWSYWGGYDQFSSMEWDSTAYPAPARFIDTLHALHAKLTVSIWPSFGPKSRIFAAMQERHFLYGEPHWNGGLVYDAYNADARALYWQFLKRGLFDVGVDGYWMDATEPEFRCSDDRYATELSMKGAGRHALGTFARYLNTYSLETTRGVYEGLRAATTTKRPFIMTRSAFAGQQRYGAVTWSGDTFATWDALRVQVAAGLNFSLSGIPYWNSDIGGFITDYHFPRGLADPAYVELYVRWFQFGAFCPMFRAHGTNIPREVWRFGNPGDEAYDALAAALRLRYRLLPYLYTLAANVTWEGGSFLRAPVMEFPNDPRVLTLGTEFLLGRSLLVCPVLRPLRHAPAYSGVDITPNHFFSPDGREHGVALTVCRGTDFEDTVLQRPTDASQLGWVGCLPADLDTAYSLTLDGRLLSEQSGVYRFFVITDGGIRLWIGDSLLIDDWNNTVRTVFSGARRLPDRALVAFRVEHRQPVPRNALLKVNWIVPETREAGNTVEDYLPGDAPWYDFWSGRRFPGKSTVTDTCPLGKIPLFVRAGSILLLGPDIQYVDERPADTLEVRVYPGADREFTLYEDAGDGFGYEHGETSLIPFRWDDTGRILTVGARRGSFAGMLAVRTLRVVVVEGGKGGGIDPVASPNQVVEYSGKPLTIPVPERGR